MQYLLCINDKGYTSYIQKGKTYTYDGPCDLACCAAMKENAKTRIYIGEITMEITNVMCTICGHRYEKVRASVLRNRFIELNDPDFKGDEDEQTIPTGNNERKVSTLS